MKAANHEHYFSPKCTDEVHGRFDAVKDTDGKCWVIDVGTGKKSLYVNYKAAKRWAERKAERWGSSAPRGPLAPPPSEQERQRLQVFNAWKAALVDAKGNITHASKALGLNPRTGRARTKNFGLQAFAEELRTQAEKGRVGK